MLQRLTATIFLSITAIFLSAQTTTGSIEHDGIIRDYILHLPTGYDESESYPFVYNLHGFTSNAGQQEFYSGMDATADANGFIVCYPNGIDASWNVGWTFGSTADDVGFLVELADQLAEEYSIDTDRLYSCGMSNGGFMSYKLACDASDRFAAIASVTGSMVPSELDSCDPARKVPVMQIHGTADATVSYDGSFISAPIEDVVSFWATRNNCNPIPQTIQIEDINTGDQSTAERIEYSDCEDDKEVVFYKIDGGAHTWPDAAISIGVTNRDFNASQEIWNFFNRFDLNGIISSNNEEIKVVTDISLFPNPVNSHVLLTNLPTDTKQITVVDVIGNIVFSQLITSNNEASINLNHLVSGLHFLIIEEKSTREVVRFMKM